jgi:hypothetical protein
MMMCRLITILNDASQQITTLLYIKRACELNKSHIISTDEDPGLRIEGFAVINLRGVSTNKTIYFIAMQTYKELMHFLLGIKFRNLRNSLIKRHFTYKLFLIYFYSVYADLLC